MLRKQLSILITLVGALCATSAWAVDGPDLGSLNTDAGLYIEGDVGGAYVPWTKTPAIRPSNAITRNGDGGATGGADLGYQWDNYWGFEAGWYWLPTVRQTVIAGEPGKGKMQSWAAYLAAKFMLPLGVRNLSGFFKVGASYRRVAATDATVASMNIYRWSPMFGVGAQYTISNYMISAQYLYFPGGRFDASGVSETAAGYYANTTLHKVGGVPAANLILVGFGYLFAL